MKLSLRRVSLATPGARDARRSWPARESLLLRLEGAQGSSGLGEASPLPGYSSDSLAEAEAALRAVPPAALERALDGDEARAVLRRVASLVPNGVPSARMALETAALDLLGQQRAAPAPTLLGALPQAERELAQLLGRADAPELLELASAATFAGFSCFKLKVGAPGQARIEARAIVELRQRLGPQPRLRLDANGGFLPADLQEFWEGVASSEIELFEEPGQLSPLLEGRLPLALDESLQNKSLPAVAAELAARQPRCLVLKPMALGGLSHCLELAELAQRAGVSALVSHSFDGPLAWRAAAALALALPAGLSHGLGPHAGLAGWQQGALPVSQAVLHSWPEPGLGQALADFF
jgi:o-succinylbenzoate synthase